MKLKDKIPVGLVVVMFLGLSLYIFNSLKLWGYCRGFLPKHLNPKCQLATKFDLKDELTNPNITYNDLNLAIERVDSILQAYDPRLETDIPVDSWPLFSHPEGIYSLKYHPKLKPIITKKTEMTYEAPYDKVEFVPIDAQDSENEFFMSISFDAGGGGSLCGNAACYNARKMGNLPLIDIKAYDSYTGAEERLRGANSTVVSLGLNFEPRDHSKYMGRISATYTTGNQRDLIHQMLETLEVSPAGFQQ